MTLLDLMEMKPRKLLTGDLRIPEKVEVVPAGYVKMPAGYAGASKVIFTKNANGTWTGAIAND